MGRFGDRGAWMGGILSCSVLYYSSGVEGDKQCFR